MADGWISAPHFSANSCIKDKQRNAVTRTINHGFPLNVMYWADKGGDGFEVIDGQQWTISIAQYVDGDFSIDGLYYHNPPPTRRSAYWTMS